MALPVRLLHLFVAHRDQAVGDRRRLGRAAAHRRRAARAHLAVGRLGEAQRLLGVGVAGDHQNGVLGV